MKMKPARSKQQVRKAKSRSGTLHQDPVEVFCRVRPLRSEDESCLKVLSANTVLLTPPENAVNYRNGNNLKELQCSFTEVFDQNATQAEVFDSVAYKLVNQLVSGRNGLLFTYGVTGSGKTYTMTGETQQPGIMPRCLDVLFRAISNYQAKKYVFKPDKMNGFEILDDEEIATVYKSEAMGFVTPKIPKTPRRKDGDGDMFFIGDRNSDNVITVDEDNLYSCFVTYVEIYNNSVFDLLDANEDVITKKLQNKMIREDGYRNMYVHGVTEVEVKSPEEAFEIFSRGQKRKKVAYTILNDESSRSHSVFTIRLVQAPLEERDELLQRKLMTISQLSLVDLAGSERTNKTKNTGIRLREAGSINTSLMTLRTCIETLRDNQLTKSNKMVPYRDSKLTLLFKNYFDGEGAVRMIICVNPRADDYDETMQVLKFAEISQEVQVPRSTPMRLDIGLRPGIRNGYQSSKRSNSEENLLEPMTPMRLYLPPTSTACPSLGVHSAQDVTTFHNLEAFLEERQGIRQQLLTTHREVQENLRRALLNLQTDYISVTQDNVGLKTLLETARRKESESFEVRNAWEKEKNAIMLKLKAQDDKLQRAKEEMREKDQFIKQLNIEKELIKEKCQSKIGLNKQKVRRELECKMQHTVDVLEEALSVKDKKIRLVQEALDAEVPLSTPRAAVRLEAKPASVASQPLAPLPLNSPFVNCTPRRGVAISNPRHRRSRSIGDSEKWLDHRPPKPVELNTVFQPAMRKRKSVTKLVDVKDVVNSKTSKYCLTTQDQDTEGELETRLYKGDVIPTCSGGAQVILNDVETLKQTSPTNVAYRKRSVPDENLQQRCQSAVEGHGKRPRS